WRVSWNAFRKLDQRATRPGRARRRSAMPARPRSAANRSGDSSAGAARHAHEPWLSGPFALPPPLPPAPPLPDVPLPVALPLDRPEELLIEPPSPLVIVPELEPEAPPIPLPVLVLVTVLVLATVPELEPEAPPMPPPAPVLVVVAEPEPEAPPIPPPALVLVLVLLLALLLVVLLEE